MARPASPGPEPRRLLVVEDQESLSVIVEGTALNCCWPPPSDVVLLDCVLPGETMWQFVLEGDRQQVPVVLMTGDPARMKEARAGERPYIFKPFTLADLKRDLEETTPRLASADTPVFVGRSAPYSEPDPCSAH